MFSASPRETNSWSPPTQRSWNPISMQPPRRRRQRRINAQRSKSRRLKRGARSVRLSFTRRSLPCATRDTSSRTRLQELKLGGMGAAPTHLAPLLELSLAQHKGAASRFEEAQRAFWAHSLRERGNLESTESESVLPNAERLRQRDRHGRREISAGRRAPHSRPAKSQNRP